MAPGKPPANDERALRKQINNLEKSIAKLDQQRKETHEQLMNATDTQSALKLHNELEKISGELEAAEMRWAELQEQLEST